MVSPNGLFDFDRICKEIQIGDVLLSEGHNRVAGVASLPKQVKSISIVTPPPVTEKIVEQAIAKGIQNIWMQPGAESETAVKKCKEHKINVIADGTCILRELGCNHL